MIAVIGEAPNRVAGPELTTRGHSGARLAQLCGLTFLEFERRFLRVNVFEEPVETWPAEAARVRAAGLMVDELRGIVTVVLLGRRASAAFLGERVYPWFTAITWPEAITNDSTRRTWYVAPHPSGRSRFWNDPDDVEVARRFWRKMAAA